jgi:hypothetical protein
MTKKDFIRKFALFIPLLNIAAMLTVNEFEAGTFNPGTIRAAIILLFLIFILTEKTPNLTSIKLVYIYLSFLFIASTLSTDIYLSLYRYLKLFISTMMFIVGLIMIRSSADFMRLNRVYLNVLIICSLYILYANIFNYGSSDYLAESFYYGSTRVNITKVMAVLLLIVPISFATISKKSPRIYYSVFLFFALVAVIIGMKRSAILGLSLGYIIYFFLTPDKNRLAKSIVSLAIILLISTPIYLDTLTDRYEVRAKRRTFDVQTEELENTEARYREYLMVMNDFERRDIITALFGTEAFNDLYYYRTNRMLHTDFMLLLSSSGVIGLLLHIAILLIIPFELLGIKPKRQSQKKIFKEVYAVNLALLACLFILSIAATVHSIEIRAFALMYMGASISFLKIRNKESVSLEE